MILKINGESMKASSSEALGIIYALECLRSENNEYEFVDEDGLYVPAGMSNGNLNLVWEKVS
jgi:hypothetical protein